MSFVERFQQLCQCCDIFSVIFVIKNLTNMKDLKNSCNTNMLADALKCPKQQSGDIKLKLIKSYLRRTLNE